MDRTNSALSFTESQIAELDVVAAWLETQGITATEDLIVRCVKEVVKRTRVHLEDRRKTLDDFPSYFAAVLSKGGSGAAPSKNAGKAERDAAEIRSRAADEKRWEHICRDLADRGDGNVIRACRRLEAEGKPVTAQAVAEICPSLLPPDEPAPEIEVSSLPQPHLKRLAEWKKVA